MKEMTKSEKKFWDVLRQKASTDADLSSYVDTLYDRRTEVKPVKEGSQSPTTEPKP